METLIKETTTLHKVLSKHLPDMSVRMIMDPVFSSYREQLGRAFHDVDVKTVAGKERYDPVFSNLTIREKADMTTGSCAMQKASAPASVRSMGLVILEIMLFRSPRGKLLRRNQHY